jgi:hypothetical protein
VFLRFNLKLKTMGKIIHYLGTVALITLVFYACEVPRSYPDTPEIKFKSARLIDTRDTLDNKVKRILLTMSVIDGDGDVGIFFGESNNIYPGFEDLDNANLFITLYEKIDGEFVKMDTVYNYATTYLEPEGQDKSLVADFEVSIDYKTVLFDFDTIKYSFYIYDRAKHQSNIGESPEIPYDTTGLFE